MHAIARARWEPPLRPVFALLAAAALLQSALLVMADPALLGRQPGHGHIFLGGQAHAHQHPGARADERAHAGVIFTPAFEVSAVAGTVVAPRPEVTAPAPPPPMIFETAFSSAPPDVPGHVSVPPPRA